MEHMNGGKWMSIDHAIVAMVEDVKDNMSRVAI